MVLSKHELGRQNHATTHGSIYQVYTYLPLYEEFTPKNANVTVLALIVSRVGNVGYRCRCRCKAGADEELSWRPYSKLDQK